MEAQRAVTLLWVAVAGGLLLFSPLLITYALTAHRGWLARRLRNKAARLQAEEKARRASVNSNLKRR